MSDKGRWVVTLDKILESIGKTEGFMVTDLHAEDILEVTTRERHTCLFKIIDPHSGLAEATGSDPRFNQPIRVYIHGSLMSPFGTSIRTKWVGLGYQLEIGVEGQPLCFSLSETVSASINGIVIMPTENKTSN